MQQKEYSLDITNQAKDNIELQHHEDLLTAIFGNASVGMALLDMNGNFYQVNQALCEMLQYTEEELLSRKYTVTHPDDLERSEFVMAQLKSGKIRKNVMEKRYVRKDGSIIYALHNLSMIQNHDGNPYLFIVQAQDITHIKAALLKAVQSDDLKTTFLQNLSHEIRTPANAILGFFQLMKDPICSMEEKMEYIDMIKHGIEQFISILNSILDISKVETHQLPIKKEITDLRTLLHEVFSTYSTIFNTLNLPGIDFTFFMTETPEPILVECDGQRVKEALGFLLENSFKFTKFGWITLGCHIIPEKEVIMFVKDSGIGIPKEKQEFILNKFRQGDESSTRQYGGLGLGLTLAREFITLQGGRLWLQSEPGQGTSVYCSLPYSSNKSFSIMGHTPLPPVEIIDLTGKSILIAEDTDSNYTVLERWLKKTNARVIWAKNGLEAIEICHRDDSINMILMDLQMPIVNGYEATRNILGFRQGLPIIAQTAYSLDFDEHRALEAGCVAYLAKPIDISYLFSLIKKHLLEPKSHLTL
ncbi:MAG: PAS domain S-box protein [Bacteroidales bacterium]|nr:PAS domain S-box protein [Bacteroidales bacterium]